MKIINEHEEHLFACIHSIRYKYFLEFLSKHLSIFSKKFRHNKKLEELDQFSKGLSVRDSWALNTSEKPGLSKLKINLASTSYLVSDDIDWKKKFSDKEDEYALHRFGWMLVEISEKNLTPQEGIRFIEHWILENQDNSGKGWDSYSISERLMNWFIIYRDDLEQKNFSELIYKSIIRQLNFLINNLEIRGTSTNNHLLNNGRCVIIAGILFGDHKLTDLGERILTQANSLIFNKSGMLAECSSHYQVLVARTYLEVLWFSSVFNRQDIFKKFVHFSKKVFRGAAFFYLSKPFPLIGDVSPDFKTGFFDQLILTGDYIIKNQARKEFNQSLNGWSYFFGFKERSLQPKMVKGNKSYYEDCSKEVIKNLFTSFDFVEDFIDSGFYYFSNSTFSIFVFHNPMNSVMPNTHGHSDLFSFIVNHSKKSIVVDLGRYSYKNDSLSRYGRSVHAHNSISIDGREPQIVHGLNGYPELLSKTFLGESPAIEVSKNKRSINLTHSGFQRISKDIKVSRTIELNDNVITVRDFINGSSKHLIESFFHFNAESYKWVDKNLVLSNNEDRENVGINFKISENNSKVKIVEKSTKDSKHFSIMSSNYGYKTGVYSIVLSQKETMPVENIYTIELIKEEFKKYKKL